MTKANDLYATGNLTEAVVAALADVKANPTQTGARMLLCELLCFAGDLERADKQLDALLLQEPKAALTLTSFRQMLRAEQARRECFNDGRAPEFLEPPSDRLKLHLEALMHIRAGDLAAAAQLLGDAERQRPLFPGTINGQAIDDFRDLDDLTSSFFEVFTSTGKYFWVPMEKVEEIEFDAPERIADLLWRPARLAVQGSADGRVFLPALYPGSFTECDDRFRLGRLTEWRGGEGSPVRGVGLRTYLAGEKDLSILELQELALLQASAEA